MSTWNVGNYHWEEHNCNAWANARLKELADGVKIDGWVLKDQKFDDVVADRTIRKNHEIRSFEFTYETQFEHNDMKGKIKFLDVFFCNIFY